MIFLTDRRRHLICYPYSIENLHRMANELGIKRCWFHKDHYDIPKKRIEEIESQCEIVTSKEIVRIKNNKDYENTRLQAKLSTQQS
jgi:tetraacyldisaccharide-1-P 4'-kinase